MRPQATSSLLQRAIVKAAAARPFFPTRMLRSFAPIQDRRALTPDEQHDVELNERNLVPDIIQTDATPISHLLSSPGVGAAGYGAGGAALGGLAGGGLGYLTGHPVLGSIVGGAVGAGVGGLHGYLKRYHNNEHLKEMMQRLPVGATKRDLAAEEMLAGAIENNFGSSFGESEKYSMAKFARLVGVAQGRPFFSHQKRANSVDSGMSGIPDTSGQPMQSCTVCGAAYNQGVCPEGHDQSKIARDKTARYNWEDIGLGMGLRFGGGMLGALGTSQLTNSLPWQVAGTTAGVGVGSVLDNLRLWHKAQKQEQSFRDAVGLLPGQKSYYKAWNAAATDAERQVISKRIAQEGARVYAESKGMHSYYTPDENAAPFPDDHAFWATGKRPRPILKTKTASQRTCAKCGHEMRGGWCPACRKFLWDKKASDTYIGKLGGMLKASGIGSGILKATVNTAEHAAIPAAKAAIKPVVNVAEHAVAPVAKTVLPAAEHAMASAARPVSASGVSSLLGGHMDRPATQLGWNTMIHGTAVPSAQDLWSMSPLNNPWSHVPAQGMKTDQVLSRGLADGRSAMQRMQEVATASAKPAPTIPATGTGYKTPVPGRWEQPKITINPSETAAATPKGVPVMVTQQMEAQLRTLGHTPEEINRMTPEQAWSNIHTPGWVKRDAAGNPLRTNASQEWSAGQSSAAPAQPKMRITPEEVAAPRVAPPVTDPLNRQSTVLSQGAAAKPPVTSPAGSKPFDYRANARPLAPEEQVAAAAYEKAHPSFRPAPEGGVKPPLTPPPGMPGAPGTPAASAWKNSWNPLKVVGSRPGQAAAGGLLGAMVNPGGYGWDDPRRYAEAAGFGLVGATGVPHLGRIASKVLSKVPESVRSVGRNIGQTGMGGLYGYGVGTGVDATANAMGYDTDGWGARIGSGVGALGTYGSKFLRPGTGMQRAVANTTAGMDALGTGMWSAPTRAMFGPMGGLDAAITGAQWPSAFKNLAAPFKNPSARNLTMAGLTATGLGVAGYAAGNPLTMARDGYNYGKASITNNAAAEKIGAGMPTPEGQKAVQDNAERLTVLEQAVATGTVDPKSKFYLDRKAQLEDERMQHVYAAAPKLIADEAAKRGIPMENQEAITNLAVEQSKVLGKALGKDIPEDLVRQLVASQYTPGAKLTKLLGGMDGKVNDWIKTNMGGLDVSGIPPMSKIMILLGGLALLGGAFTGSGGMMAGGGALALLGGILPMLGFDVGSMFAPKDPQQVVKDYYANKQLEQTKAEALKNQQQNSVVAPAQTPPTAPRNPAGPV